MERAKNSLRTTRRIPSRFSALLLVIFSFFTTAIDSSDTVNNIQVSEGIHPATVLLTLPHKRGFRYLLQDASRNGASLFHVSPEGVLTTKAALDREDPRGYIFDLVIVCRENNQTGGGNATNIRVTILDENDNTPKFPKDLYTAWVSENSPPGSYVHGLEGVFAEDLDTGLNSVLFYSILTEGNEAGLFAVEMNELAGVKFLRLKTTAQIDREKTAFFVLTIQVKDNGTNPLSSTTQVRINIVDQNDCFPLFDPPIYSLSINENTAIGTSVLQVKATDDDEGINSEVYYYFTKDHQFFAINAHTGVVQVVSQLNFELGNYFELIVVAVDRGGIVRHNSSTLVKIRIIDVIGYPPREIKTPNKPPVFNPRGYYVKIREDLPLQAVVAHVRTLDVAEYSRSRLQYELFPAHLRDTFRINAKSGIITLLRSLDYETKSSYTFKIRAKDLHNHRVLAETEVIVQIADVDENFHPPVFPSSLVVKTMPSNADKNTVIATISANDSDKGQNGKLKYSVVGGSGAGRFFLDENNGVLKPFASQNKEGERYDLHIEGRDGAKYPRTARLYMLILPHEQNTKRPHFLTPSQTAMVQENSASGTFVAVIRAEFRGKLPNATSKIFKYKITGGKTGGEFAIGEETGVIYTTTKLDREHQSRYYLDVKASIKEAPDSMSSPAQLVVIVTDVNDNDPKFIKKKFQVRIKENQGPIDNLLCLIATDADSGSNAKLTYSIVDGNTQNLFSIHPSLGILSIRDSLDFEKKRKHSLTVRVSDGGTPSRSSTVRVNVNVEDANDPPVFLQTTYEVVVSDSTKTGTIIAVLDIMDEDSGYIYEGLKPVSVEEDAQPGNTLTLINVTDEDRGTAGQFKCTIEDVDADEMDTFNFRTVRQGCALTLSSFLEYSQRSHYSFKVRATDQADSSHRRTTTANVIVRVRDGNNHDPTFPKSSYWIPLPEDTAIGTTIMKITTTDLDSGSNAATTYTSSSDIFSIHPSDGTIKLSQRAEPNRKYTFAVTAIDNGKPRKSSVVKVSVSVHSVSDSAPKFRHSVYRKNVSEDLNVQADVLNVEAKNNAGSGMKLSYYLVGGDRRKQFRIDTDTGWLSLKQSLDYERQKEYKLIVRAVQQGWTASMPELPAETTVIINVMDINDNAPRFAIPQDPLVIFVDQFLPAGAIVKKLTAYDRDSGSNAHVKYAIENAVSSPFVIDSNTGVITTTKVLEYAVQASYSFTVTATDSTSPFNKGRANIVVKISDVRPPVEFLKTSYTMAISEESPVGMFLLKIGQKYSGHGNLKYTITHGNRHDAFCIDVTGEVRLRTRLDRENITSYKLKIAVKENKAKIIGPTLKFTIQDVNDNAPSFDKPVYKITVKENLKGGDVIGTLSARDPDSGENARLIYSIINYENKNSNRRFAIDLNTGVLRITTTLDREDIDQHVLTVKAEDAGAPKLSVLARVVVVVQDVNDHSPRFSSPSYSLNIPMNHRVRTPVFQAVAHDYDRDANGAIRYRIVSGNAGRYFSVRLDNGMIFLDKPLSELEKVNMKIQAHDSGFPAKYSSADVNFVVHPLSGPPRFLSSPFIGSVTENVPGGRSILQVRAASLDPVMYSVISGNKGDKFVLHPGTGWLTTASSLDHEERSQYILVVMATDLTNRMSRVRVIINVINVNDNVPRFSNIVKETGIIEGSAHVDVLIGSQVMTIDATDADRMDELRYNISDPRAARYFEITSKGQIKSKKVLTDLETPFVFKVTVRDSVKPVNTASAIARLVLLKYQLKQGKHQAFVLESASVGSQVTILNPVNPIKNAQYYIQSPLETFFRIDQKSGTVVVKKSLDFETSKVHYFIAQVQNSENRKDYTNIDVIVRVLDANDNKPVFIMKKTKGLYYARINLNAVPDTLVYQLNATDKDTGSNGEVRYRMVKDRDNFFQVDARTGSIKTKGRNLLMLPWYNLTVAAYDLGQPSLASDATVNVQVGGFSPMFDKKDYVFYVNENTQRGMAVGSVTARSFTGVKLWYSIVQGNDNGKFVLDSNTGLLTLPNPLDYERDSNVYYIKIRAEETQLSQRLFSDINIKILLRDLNDNPPEFVKQRYVDSLPESAPVGTTVLAVTATDRDSGINGQFRYFTQSQYFAVDPYTGWIITKEPLDYETMPRHAFLVVAQDSGSPVLNGTARVVVQLTNVNDNKPKFSQNLYNVFIAENAGADQVVATVHATDKDLDDVTYSIVSGDNTTNFVIDSKTGVIRLIKNRKPELRGPFYVMNISATDGMHVSQAMVVIAIEDVNNHKPVFTACKSYKPTVPEHSPPRTFVLKVVAEDKDTGVNGEIEYSIERAGNSPWHFDIDSKTGVVTTLEEFDREEKSQYQLHIIGRDGGPDREDAERLMGFCQLDVRITDKNDHPPVFQNKHYEATIGEDFDIGRSVLHVSASDKDAGTNALITYSFEKTSLFFAIDNATGTITTKKKLTGATRKFPLRVIAQDNGEPQLKSHVDVTITVFGDGNAPPKFTQAVYTAHVREDVPTSISVIKVTAKANNNQNIYYSIVPGNLPSTNNPKRFQIGTITGEVQTSHLLDYEVTANFSLTIRAETGSNPPGINFATLNIHIEDVNDSPPEFRMPRYQGHVAENEPIGTSVIQVQAVDLDKGENGRVAYKFVQEDSRKYFSVDERTGVIKTKQVFDREYKGRYPLVVIAEDHGKPRKRSTTIVEVIIKDENDNPPIFEQQVYNISIFEDASIGSNVLKVSASDKDLGINARVSYQITDGNTDAVFAINRGFGEITVARSLDRETKDFYKLEITARDGKNSGRATVNVKIKDVNDNNPKFENQTYQAVIYEEKPEGTSVMRLRATDPDEGLGGKFIFSISGQGLGSFKIDPNTGVISTKRRLDREKKARYDFLAFAVDAPGKSSRRTGSTDVTVIVRDINDNAPQFPNYPYIGHVEENMKAGASVMVMSAVDADDPNENGNAVMTYELIYDANGVFSIDRDSGLIRTKQVLDRERRDTYVVQVGASDKGHPPQEGMINVTIKVDDTNDQKPKFVQRKFQANISESADLGSTILTLRATDGDIGINAKLRFSIEKGNEDRHFRIEEETGRLQVAKSLDYEKIKYYDLGVKVRDSGIPSYTDTADVYIEILDDNDNPPRFNPPFYSTSVKENITVGTKLLQVTATDRDTGGHKEFRFSISEGDPHGQFKVDARTGELFVQKPLDREADESHILFVRATNIAESKPLYGQASVSIVVEDVNDNGPHFDAAILHPIIPENEPPSYRIIKISATDPDLSPKNGGPFTYGIHSGNEEGLFEMTRDGVLKSKVSFDREKKSVYELKIWGNDSGIPPMVNYTTIFISIKDRNDHQHEKAHLDLSMNSYEGHFLGGHVGYVYVKDKDIDDLRYYELVGKNSDIFEVVRLSGSIVSKPNPPEGVFTLEVKVSDRDSDFQPVVCTVTLRVRRITEEAMRKSVAIRIRGISSKQFLNGSFLAFKQAIAGSLGTTRENIDLFSIQNVTDIVRPMAIDIRFAAHGSPYYSPEKMIALIKSKRINLKSFNVASIGVDPCQHEPCKYGSCRAELRASGRIEVVSNPGQSFTSIIANSVGVCDTCGSGKKMVSSCAENPCKNGGTCRNASIGHACTCRQGYTGDNCELTTRSFRPREWIWLPPLRQCRVSTMSLEFATKDANGLLFYAGPTSPIEVGQDDVYDFVALELYKGRVYVSVCLGNRDDVLRIGVESSASLNDGKWHHVQVYRNETYIRLMVDHCKKSIINENFNEPKLTENREMCETEGRMKTQTKKFLNIKDPFQLGGISTRDMMYPELRTKDYTGCIRNVINEGKLYDLKSPSNQKGSKEGCPVMDYHCTYSSCDPKSTCVGAWSGYSCECAAGRRGTKCSDTTEPFFYENRGITQYLFKSRFKYEPRETKIQLRIRTRDEDGGVLLHSEGTETGEHSTLALLREKTSSSNASRLIVVYLFNVGDGEATVKADTVDVGDGKWCTITVDRYRNTAKLTVRKEGVNYRHSGSTRGRHTLLILDPIRTYLGGIPMKRPSRKRQRRNSRVPAELQKNFTGCVDDVRFHGYQLHYNGSKDFAIALATGVKKGCDSAACAANPCPATEWCHDVWRKHVCYPRLCASSPCMNGGTCVESVDENGKNMFYCRCTPEYQGALCDLGRAVVSVRPDIGYENGLIIGLALLVVMLIISFCIIFMYIRRSRKYSYNVTVEEVFKRDNVADYHIDGGVEEDVDDRFRDYIRSFEDGSSDYLPTAKNKLLECEDPNKDRGYGGSSDASPTFILLRPVRNIKKSPSLSRKSSEDEFYDGADYHYGRAVAVDLSNRNPPNRRSDPSDLKKKSPEQRRSVPNKLNITVNPLHKNSKPEKGKESREMSPVKALRGRPEEKIDEGVESAMSSSDEGFASPEACSPPQPYQEYVPSNIEHPVQVEIPAKSRSKSPKEEDEIQPWTKAPVKDKKIAKKPGAKHADVGSDPDVVSSPPDKVPTPEEMFEKEPTKKHGSPPPKTSEHPKEKEPRIKEDAPLTNGRVPSSDDEVDSAPDDFPPPYDPDFYDMQDDFPPPPQEALCSAPSGKKLDPNNLPHPMEFLPLDTVEPFEYEGGGSPSGSLSSLGSDSGDEISWEDVNDFGERFRKLAAIYGMPPSVCFNPHDEIIK